VAIYRAMDYSQAEEIYAEAEELVALPDFEELQPEEQEEVAERVPPKPTVPEQTPVQQPEEPEPAKPVYVDPYADELSNMDFTALREVNDDILGWILIPNTRVSYPLVQGEDNDYYLKRTWRKTRSDVGSIFVEHQCSGDLADFNTIIYGHRMNNNSMFGSLKHYKTPSYMTEHPIIYITDDNGCHSYEVFAAYEPDVTSMTYRIGSFTDAEKQAYIDWCLEQSVVDCGVVPTIHDRIVTLSTCTGRGYDTRWVVQGVMRGEVPDETGSAASEEPEFVEESTLQDGNAE